jgi:hypothetical protein
MKKVYFLFLTALLACFTASAQSASSSNPFAGGRWQGRIVYKDSGGISHSELYELILVPNGSCIVTVSGKQDGQDVVQDTDGLWSFDETFFRLECDFPDPVFEHLSAINWVSVYQFDALKSRFTLLVKPYPDAPAVIRTAFNKVDE